MYPTLSHFFNDIFGWEVLLPIQTFGFFVALVFFINGIVIVADIKRKEREGIFKATQKKVLVGGPAEPTDLLIGALIGFLIGYKFGLALTDYSSFALNPQAALFSLKGSFPLGVLGAALVAGLNWHDANKKKLDKPRWETKTIRPHQHTVNFLLIGAVTGIIGAKIFHNLEYWDDFIQNPLRSLLSFNGLTFYGGFIVAAFFVAHYGKKNGFKLFHLMDVAAPIMALGYGVGRIGCHTSGDGDWGVVAQWGEKLPGFLPEWFWQYTYPNNVIKEGIPIEGCVGEFCKVLPQAVYPTPLWEAILSIGIFVILWSVRKKIKIPAMLFAIYLVLSGFERFFIEKIRVNIPYHIGNFEITQAEIISSVTVLGGIIFGAYLYKNRQRLKEY